MYPFVASASRDGTVRIWSHKRRWASDVLRVPQKTPHLAFAAWLVYVFHEYAFFSLIFYGQLRSKDDRFAIASGTEVLPAGPQNELIFIWNVQSGQLCACTLLYELKACLAI